MLITILVLTILFIPFFMSLAHKNNTWVNRFMVFIFCIAGSNMVFLSKLGIDETLAMNKQPSELSYIIMIMWAVATLYFGIHQVLKEK